MVSEKPAAVKRKLVWALVAIAAVTRIGLVLYSIHGHYDPYGRLYGDMAKYLALGVSLSRHEGLSLHYRPVLAAALQGRDVTAPAAIPTASRSPGYPLFLALLFTAFGYRLYLVMIVQAVLSTLTAVFIYLTAREINARPLWALGFAALYYPFAFDAVYMLSECLLTCCTAASLWLIVRPHRGWAAGVMAGITVLIKSITLPFFAIIPPLVNRSLGLVYWMGFALVLLPWGLRNYVHTGVPYLTPPYAGYQLIQLHNPADRDFALFDRRGDLTETYPGLEELAEEVRDRAPMNPDPVAEEYLRDHELFREAAHYIRADPSQFVRAVEHSIANTWRIDYPTANWIRWLNGLVLYVALLPFVLLGAVRAMRTGPTGARLLLAFLVYFVAAHAVFASEIRYRISAMPAYFVLAAYGLPAKASYGREARHDA